MRWRGAIVVAAVAAMAAAACAKKGGGAGTAAGSAAGSAAGAAAPGGEGGSGAGSAHGPGPSWAAAGSAAAAVMPGAAPAGDAGTGAPAAAHADPPLAIVPVRAAELPAGVTVRGELESAARFADAQGENYVLFSSDGRPGVLGPDGASTRSKVIYADLWLVPPSGKPRVVKQARDFVQDCFGELIASFRPGAFEVTDLDHDGVGEVWLGYQLGCRSDVSPETYKLMAFENGTKYILRGTTRTEMGGQGDSQVAGGDFTPDPAAARWPPAFLAHAKALWAKTADDEELPPGAAGGGGDHPAADPPSGGNPCE